MKSFIVALFVIACGAVVLCDETASAGQGDSVSSILYNLLEKLGENLSTGDLNKVTEFLKTSEARVTELLSKEPSEKVREALKKVQADVSQLVQKLSSGEASLDDVRVFLNNEKEKFKNRLTDRIKDLSKEKKME